jgi:UDP-N-acetylmuramoylalanine--D-glutamate ligase
MISFSDKPRLDVRDMRVTVIGLGRSGFYAAQLARNQGADVFVSDANDSDLIKEYQRELVELGISIETGAHSDRIYSSDLWILSPGVPKNSKIVKIALKRSIYIVSEIEFTSWFTDHRIIAITGSNGKTTTSNILYQMCQTEKVKGILAGNVGIPFAKEVLGQQSNPTENAVFILEVSSFQLEFIHHFRPFISIYLNISPDHLDRHESMEEYVNAKLEMIKNQLEGDYILYNGTDHYLQDSLIQQSSATALSFCQTNSLNTLFSVNNTKIINPEHNKLILLNEIGLPGTHNLCNLIAAASAAHLIGVSNKKIADVMSSFTGIEHRLEKVGIIKGVTFVNDSKATNIDAVKVALESFNQPIILILGGKDKGGDFSRLEPFRNRIKSILAYGDAREKITADLFSVFQIHEFNLLSDAVHESYNLAAQGDLVLLSPGCTSFDQFINFEDRGKKFKQWVEKLEGES